MKYFNGFSLTGEEIFFKNQLLEHEFVVAGFSYGAIKAFEYAYNSSERIDRLILISPAFFQNQKKSFIRTQLRYFKADGRAYRNTFLKNVAYPSSIDLTEYLSEGSIEELDALLSYHWEREQILELINRGITIEVFMGECDKIVNSQKSFEFFSELVSVYYIKNVGHLLQEE